MDRQFIFLDDSGDPGLNNSNTPRMVVAAVLLACRENVEKLSAAINGFRAGLGWGELDEFKFSSTRKSVIKDLLRFVRKFEFAAYAAVVDKAKIYNTPQLSSGENLYSYLMKELLLRLPLSEPTIVIDGVTDKKQIQRMRTYLRQALKQSNIEKCKIGFADSRKEAMVQLADMIAGSVARSFDAAKADHGDYLSLIMPKIKGIYDILP